MRWSLLPSWYYAEDRLSFGELLWKTLRSLVSIWVITLFIFIARIVAGRLFTVNSESYISLNNHSSGFADTDY